MALDVNSVAPVVGAAVKNEQFAVAAANLPRKIMVVGNYDETILTVPENEPQLALSPEAVGAASGWGFMAHRLAKASHKGSQGVETWITYQPEDGAAVVATGSIDISGTAGASGTIHFFVAGDYVAVPVAKGDDGAAIIVKLVAKVTADKELPVTAVIGTPTTKADLTSKTKGTWGNDIDLAANLGFQQETPAGLTVVIVPMASGASVGDIQDALDAMGTGDEANKDQYTDFSDGYGQDTATLDAVSAYVGEGNEFTGLYSKTVGRPFRTVNGDVDSSAGALAALIALGDGRKLDRASGTIGVPGTSAHPAELAALAMGIMAKTNNNRVAESYIGKTLTGVRAPASSFWTKDYDNRDLAVKAGISPTTIESGVVKMSSVLTYYHPDDVAIASNGYRSQRNIGISQNVLWNTINNFKGEKWQGVYIVADKAKVTSTEDQKKARSVSDVIDDLISLTRAFESKGWIYDAAWTINKLLTENRVTIRAGGLGFSMSLPLRYSGEAGIFDTEIPFDTALDIAL